MYLLLEFLDLYYYLVLRENKDHTQLQNILVPKLHFQDEKEAASIDHC